MHIWIGTLNRMLSLLLLFVSTCGACFLQAHRSDGSGDLSPSGAHGEDQISVDVAASIRPVDRRIIGINTNYLTDHAAIRGAGQGYLPALRQLGVGSLRYPEGEMADGYLWSTAPFATPKPTLARTGPQEWPSGDPVWVSNLTDFNQAPLDFDQFMAYSRDIGAEPTLIVAFDSMYKPATLGGSAPTKAELLDTAVSWVRYANIVKGYDVKYWEIGNESYFNAYNGGARANDYARDLVEFSRAMKAVDPTIKIGANGPAGQDDRGELDTTGSWWQTVLQLAAPDIDFLAVHSYPVWQWGGYDRYRTNTPNFVAAAAAADAALRVWAPAHADRIRIAVTELSAIDWSKQGAWANTNDLGHALVLFEMLGQHLAYPRVAHAQVWGTRWTNAGGTETLDTLDPLNGLLPTGRAMAIWGQFLHSNMVQSTSTAMVRTFASYDPHTGELSIFLINKDTLARSMTVALSNYSMPHTAAQWALRGDGPADRAPTWGQVRDLASAGGSVALTLDPVSITVIVLRPTTGAWGGESADACSLGLVR